MRRSHVRFAVIAVLAMVGRVEAAPLSDLINGTTIQVGGLTFHNFTLHDVTQQNSTPADLLTLDISGITNGLGESGLSFGPMSVIVPNGQSLAVLRFILEYDVTATDPLLLVSGVHHTFTASVNRSSSMIMSSQAGFSPNLNAYIQDLIGFQGTGENVEQSVDNAEGFLTPVVTQHMLHDINLRGEVFNVNGNPVLGRLTTREVEVTYQTTAVPEPSTAALLGAAAAALGVWRARPRRWRFRSV